MTKLEELKAAHAAAWDAAYVASDAAYDALTALAAAYNAYAAVASDAELKKEQTNEL